jgi:RNA polymerase sigma factor FliA
VDSTKPVVHLSLDGQDTDEGDSRAIGDRLPDPGRPVDAGLISHETKEALKRAIAELPERQRQCVTMYYGSELTLAEIAAVFDLTVSRVSQILSEAREKLRKKLASLVDSEDLGAA